MIREEAIYYLQSSGFSEEQIRTIEQAFTCEDAISRQDVLDLAKKGVLISNGNYEGVCKAINELPPVNPLSKDYNTIYYTPQPKTGNWIFDEILDKHYYCSECKSMGVDYWDYCPYCGAKMVEPQESEVSNADSD